MADKVRYVQGDKMGLLGFSQSLTARQTAALLRKSQRWILEEFPIVYKLVPVTLADIHRQIAKEKKAKT